MVVILLFFVFDSIVMNVFVTTFYCFIVMNVFSWMRSSQLSSLLKKWKRSTKRVHSTIFFVMNERVQLSTFIHFVFFFDLMNAFSWTHSSQRSVVSLWRTRSVVFKKKLHHLRSQTSRFMLQVVLMMNWIKTSTSRKVMLTLICVWMQRRENITLNVMCHIQWLQCQVNHQSLAIKEK